MFDNDKQWQYIFDAIADFIFIQDNDFTIIKVNKSFADALKLKPEEIIGKKCYELLHKKDQPWPECPFEMTKKDKKPHEQEVDDPNIGVPLLVNTSPIFDDNGQFIGSVHIAHDISAIKNRDKELKQKIHELEVFFKAAVDRELKIDELKKQIKELEAKANNG